MSLTETGSVHRSSPVEEKNEELNNKIVESVSYDPISTLKQTDIK